MSTPSMWFVPIFNALKHICSVLYYSYLTIFEHCRAIFYDTYCLLYFTQFISESRPFQKQVWQLNCITGNGFSKLRSCLCLAEALAVCCTESVWWHFVNTFINLSCIFHLSSCPLVCFSFNSVSLPRCFPGCGKSGSSFPCYVSRPSVCFVHLHGIFLYIPSALWGQKFVCATNA